MSSAENETVTKTVVWPYDPEPDLIEATARAIASVDYSGSVDQFSNLAPDVQDRYRAYASAARKHFLEMTPEQD